MKEKIKNKIKQYVRTNYQLLDYKKFENGNSLFNQKCHLNSVQYAVEKKCSVLMCACISDNEVFIHFINKNNQRYIDNTLGVYGIKNYDYYLIKEISPQEYGCINVMLMNAKYMLINVNTNFFQRAFKIIDEDDI